MFKASSCRISSSTFLFSSLPIQSQKTRPAKKMPYYLYVQMFHSRFPAPPFFLFRLSLGGALVTQLTCQHRLFFFGVVFVILEGPSVIMKELSQGSPPPPPSSFFAGFPIVHVFASFSFRLVAPLEPRYLADHCPEITQPPFPLSLEIPPARVVVPATSESEAGSVSFCGPVSSPPSRY